MARNAEGKKLFNNTLLTIKLFIMNKRFFTLMVAALLAGAPLANQAFAVGSPAPTALASMNLASGVQFITDAKLVAGDGYYYFDNTLASVTSYTFTITNYSNKTFGLSVDGKPVYNNVDKEIGVFVAKKGSPLEVTTKTDFTTISTFVVGTAGDDMISSASLKTKKLVLDEEDLNANLSGKGFKFSFPDAVVQPEFNPFGTQMIAVKASLIDASLTGVMFVVNDAAGQKLLAEINETRAASSAKVDAASFIVVNPNKNFGITGLSAAAGEGYDFTTVKGEKLAAQNDKANGKIAFANGDFTITEKDQLNAADEYCITVTPYLTAGTDQNGFNSQLHVGVYSLTAGGLKSYVTTKANETSLVKATTAGNTYAAATDLLKVEAPAVYNIYYVGQPAIGENSNKGKYLGASGAVAPSKINLNFASAQWIVQNVGPKGEVTFVNKGTQLTTTMNLYKTEKAGEYQTKTGEIIKLIPATEKGSFLTFTDAQLKQTAQIQFKGSDNMVAKNIYLKNDNGVVKGTNDDSKNIDWEFVEVDPIYHVNAYSYLKGNEVKTNGKDTLAIAAYSLITDVQDVEHVFAWDIAASKAILVDPDLATANEQVLEYVFQQNLNGSYTMWNVAGLDRDNNNAGTAYAVYVDPQTAAINGSTTPAAEYSSVTINFRDLGESLPAVARYATLDSEDGSISLKENKNGIIEGIIASEGLTLWLDTANTSADDLMPTFYISKGIAADTAATKAVEAGSVRNFMYYPADSAYHWSAGDAAYVSDTKYTVDGSKWNPASATNSDLKAIFRPAALVGIDTLNTVADSKEVVVTEKNGLDNFKFFIAKEVGADGYKVFNVGGCEYLYNLNGKLAFTDDETKALVITLGEGDPTANEAIAAEAGVQVIGGQGVVTVQGAAGKVVTVANILGQTIANQVADSDNVTIAAPAGIVVVSVDGEATKVIVK